ncbi:hypothetical protein S83_025146 [Arachis hypogaea]
MISLNRYSVLEPTTTRVVLGVRKLLAVMSSTFMNGGGGVRDLYGEDRATEDQLIITPWSFSVSSGCTLLRDRATTKASPSLREKEMLITCEAFCHQQYSIKNFRRRG